MRARILFTILGVALGFLGARILAPSSDTGKSGSPEATSNGGSLTALGPATDDREPRAQTEGWLAGLAAVGGADYAEQAQVWEGLQQLGADDTISRLLELQTRKNDFQVGRLRYMLAQHLAETDPALALKMSREHEGADGFPFHALREAAIRIMAGTDPAGALAWIKAYPNPDGRSDMMGQLLQTVGRENPQQLVAWLRDRNVLGGAEGENAWAIKSAIDRYAEVDPSAAAKLVSTLAPGRIRFESIGGVANRWAASDPQSALAWARGLGSNRFRERAIKEIVSVLSKTDRTLAIEIATEHKGNNMLHDRMASDITKAWARTDPEGALAWIKSSAAGERPSVFGDWLNTAIESGYDPVLAMQAIEENIPAANRQGLIEELARTLTGRDREGAAAWLASVEDSDLRIKLAAEMASGAGYSSPRWAAQFILDSRERESDPNALAATIPNIATYFARYDPAAAIEWAKQLGSDEAVAMGRAVGAWAEADPAGAAEYVAGADVGAARRDSLVAIAKAWSLHDPQEALEWASALEDQEAVAVTSTLVKRLVGTGDLESAAVTLEAMLGREGSEPLGKEFENAASSVASKLVSQDHERAIQLVESLQDEGARSTATAGMVASWLSKDPEAASEWVTSLAPGRARDGAVEQIVRKVASSDGEAAFAWAATIGDTGRRVTGMEASLREWSKQNPDAAAAALAATQLGSLHRERLEKALK